MRLVIDLPSRGSIVDFGNLSPAPVNQIKSADTAVLDIYFVEEGIVQDLGSGTSIRFGLIAGNDPVIPLLVYDTVFNRMTDENGNIFYQGFPIFNNSTLLGALGGALNLTCSGEIRYQVPTGEISHSTDIPFLVWRTILPESYYTTTTASVTQPAIGANVTVPVVASGFLAPNSSVSVGSGYDTMSVVSVPDGISFVGHNLGTGSSAPGHVFPSGTIVSLASPNVLATYPDVSTLELKVNKSVPSGYAPLDSTGHLLLAEMPSGVELTAHKNVASGYAGLGSGATVSASVIPVDGVTTSVSAGKLVAMAGPLQIVSTTQAAFTVPAVGSSVAINTPMVNLVPNAYYVIGGGAGVYQLLSITDPNHGQFVNAGSYGNASPGTVIPYGVTLQNTGVPGIAGMAGGGGIGATTTANFTWPAIGSNVTVSVHDATPFAAIFQDWLVYVGPNFGVLQIASINVGANTITLLNNNQYTSNAGASPSGTIPTGSSINILCVQVYDADLSGSSGGTTLVTDDTPSSVPWLPAIRRLKATDSSITLDNSHPTYVGIKAGLSIRAYAYIFSANWTWASNTPIPFDQAYYNVGGMWASGSPTLLSVTTLGTYSITAQLTVIWGVVNASTGIFRVSIYYNGSVKCSQDFCTAGYGSNVGSGTQTVRISANIAVTTTGAFDLRVITLAGTPPTSIQANVAQSFFQADYLGA